jgi:hypothetical protein
MTEAALSPLRRRMIEDMTVRNFVEKAQNDYIRHVKNLTAFLGPNTATAEDLRLYPLHLTEAGVRPPTINSAVSALRFFFSVTVGRPAVTKPLTFVAEPRKIPVVLSPEEVARFLEAAPGPKYKAALSAAYDAGLRVSEVVALKVSDVVDHGLVLVGDVGDRGRQREHDMEVRRRQEIGRAVCKPLLRGCTLALRAMPVAAGVIGDRRVRAALAACDVAAERRRAATLDRRHDLQLTEAHMAGRQAAPWSRKMSATSSAGRTVSAGALCRRLVWLRP